MKKIVDHQIVRVKRAAEHLPTGSYWAGFQPMPPGIILAQVYTHVVTIIRNPGPYPHGPVKIGDTVYVFNVPVEIPKAGEYLTMKEMLNRGRYQAVNDEINKYVEPCTNREAFLFHIIGGTPNKPVILNNKEGGIVRYFRYKNRSWNSLLDWWGFNDGNEYVI